MKSTISRVYFFPCLLIFSKIAVAQFPMTCFPSCSEAEISATEHRLKAEIVTLEGKLQNLQSELSSLENDIAFVRFNERVTQVRSVIKSTNETGDQRQLISLNSFEEINTKLQKVRQSLLEIEKERKIILGYLSDLALLIPLNSKE